MSMKLSQLSATGAGYDAQLRWIVFAGLLAFRLLNALTLSTFFQPDEYFQSLEPAWALAFGPDSHAWITWVCSHQDRER